MFLYNIGYLFNTPHYKTRCVKIELLCKLYTYDSYIREVLVALHKKITKSQSVWPVKARYPTIMK